MRHSLPRPRAGLNRGSASGLHRRPAGRLETGHLADMTVLDDNPLTGDTDRIAVTHTIVGGTVAFARPPQ